MPTRTHTSNKCNEIQQRDWEWKRQRKRCMEQSITHVLMWSSHTLLVGIPLHFKAKTKRKEENSFYNQHLYVTKLHFILMYLCWTCFMIKICIMDLAYIWMTLCVRGFLHFSSFIFCGLLCALFSSFLLYLIFCNWAAFSSKFKYFHRGFGVWIRKSFDFPTCSGQEQ